MSSGAIQGDLQLFAVLFHCVIRHQEVPWNYSDPVPKMSRNCKAQQKESMRIVLKRLDLAANSNLQLTYHCTPIFCLNHI